jgi:hypothetical protein
MYRPVAPQEYTEKRYCDDAVFRQRINGLSEYIEGTELQSILQTFKAVLPTLSLSTADKKIAGADLGIIEPQLASNRSQSAAVKESLISLRSVAEKAAGGFTSGILHLIHQYLQHHT